VRFDVRTTTGGFSARTTPYSGIVTWLVESTSSRNASNSSSARSISSMSNTASCSRSARRMGRSSRNRSAKSEASSASVSARLAGWLVASTARRCRIWRGTVPVIKGLAGVYALVALEPDQRDIQHNGQRLGEGGLAGARLALEQQRPVHGQAR
jgi:hypothetical protein